MLEEAQARIQVTMRGGVRILTKWTFSTWQTDLCKFDHNHIT
jgi:hypothetical protein